MVDAAAGQAPRAGVEALDREPDEQHVALDGIAATHQGVRADPLHPERRPVGQRLLDHRHGGHGAVEHVAEREPGRVDRRAVDLDDARLRGVGRHPPVVHDPQRVVVGPPPVAAHPGLVGGVHASLLADDRVEAGLLADLADDGVPRVLPVVDPSPGQGPLLVGGDPRRQLRQQDALVAHDDGVRRHSLSPGQGHGLQSRPRPRADRRGRAGSCRSMVLAMTQPLQPATSTKAKLRDPWLDNAKMVLVTIVVVGHMIVLVPDRATSRRAPTTSSTTSTSRRSCW